MAVTKLNEEYAIWLYLRDAHCTFVRKRKDLRICTNDYTVNGVHAYIYCPLIAKKYITVKLDGTTVVAFKKNPDKRVPSQMWEEISLSQTKEKGMQELKSHAVKMELHTALKEELLSRANQLFEIAEELRRAPEPEEDLLVEDVKEELLEEKLLEEELEEEDLLDEKFEELKE
ncbi:MAG: 60S ribosomal protein L28 [Candidatus Heimdallarchaeota archaeon]